MPVGNVAREQGMLADDMVDAALAGFDRGEVFTTPAPPNVVDWQAYKSTRQVRVPIRSSRRVQHISRVPVSKRHFADEKRVDGSLEGF
jgi:hypothetical protein